MEYFSIVIPSYNRRELTARAVESVFANEAADCEVTVVDDGSTDGTAHYLRERFDDPRPRIITQDHLGATAARNRGGFAATKAWLVFLDSDDELEKDALEQFRQRITAKENRIGLVCGAAKMIAVHGETREIRRPRELGGSYNNHRGLFLAGTFALRRQIFQEVGGFSIDCRGNQHKEFALRLVPYCDEQGYDIVTTDATTVRVHEHDGEHLRDNMESLLEGSLYILRNHERQLRKSPTHFADWCTITGVYAAKLGRLDVARRLLFKAARNYPRKTINFARLIVACCPPLARRVWRR